jgi:hypothetical protein
MPAHTIGCTDLRVEASTVRANQTTQSSPRFPGT